MYESMDEGVEVRKKMVLYEENGEWEEGRRKMAV